VNWYRFFVSLLPSTSSASYIIIINIIIISGLIQHPTPPRDAHNKQLGQRWPSGHLSSKRSSRSTSRRAECFQANLHGIAVMVNISSSWIRGIGVGTNCVSISIAQWYEFWLPRFYFNILKQRLQPVGLLLNLPFWFQRWLFSFSSRQTTAKIANATQYIK